jgi:hypothetical protein
MERRIGGPQLRERDTIVPMTHRQVIASTSDCLELQQMFYTKIPINLATIIRPASGVLHGASDNALHCDLGNSNPPE